MHSPLQIQFALAFYCSDTPEEMIGYDTYDSEAGKAAKEWLCREGLVDPNASPWPVKTERLSVFVNRLLSQPLPVQIWTYASDTPEPPHD